MIEMKLGRKYARVKRRLKRRLNRRRCYQAVLSGENEIGKTNIRIGVKPNCNAANNHSNAANRCCTTDDINAARRHCAAAKGYCTGNAVPTVLTAK